VPLSPSMASVLAFFVTVLSDMPPRRISFIPASRERVLTWSVASYEAGTGELGFVLFDPELEGSGFLYSAGLLPQDLA